MGRNGRVWLSLPCIIGENLHFSLVTRYPYCDGRAAGRIYLLALSTMLGRFFSSF